MDTEIGCFMKPEVAMQRRRFSREFKLEAVKLVRERGVSAAQAERHDRSHDLKRLDRETHVIDVPPQSQWHQARTQF
jgi:transposase-like protein